ncbi:MAG: peptidase T [Sporolactobacillus sp.]
MKEELVKRFISYVTINTQSDEESPSCPSTAAQWTLLNKLADELKTIGLSDVSIDENGYLMATLPATVDKDVLTIGFMAHVDTATDFTGDGVHPQFVENYDGGDIVLNQEKAIVLSPSMFPDLKKYKGQTLITTDGTTLLGADDKAGVAEIVTAMAYLVQHPEIAHGRIRIALTPDEEIGRGPHKFDVTAFDAKLAYTIDGGALGGLEYENFNAARAKLTFQGSNVHPGSAKNKMVNSIKLAIDFQNQIPASEAPEYTDGYEGFYHLLEFTGDAEQTKLNYIIRDFDKDKFEAKKNYVRELTKKLQDKYGKDAVTLKLYDEYYNMKEKVEEHKEVVDVAYKAMTNLGIEPQVLPIRGGTDGAQISFMGLPTPNLFAGGENFHGKYEYVSVQTMVKAAETIVEISRLFAEQN